MEAAGIDHAIEIALILETGEGGEAEAEAETGQILAKDDGTESGNVVASATMWM